MMALIPNLCILFLVGVIFIHVSESKEDKVIVNNIPIAMETASRRWSIFYIFEKSCVRKCRSNGKPYGGLIGTVCQCLCPQEKATSTCDSSTLISCSAYCKFRGFKRGGDCYTDTDCFCFARVHKDHCDQNRRPFIQFPPFIPEFFQSGIMTALSNIP